MIAAFKNHLLEHNEHEDVDIDTATDSATIAWKVKVIMKTSKVFQMI